MYRIILINLIIIISVFGSSIADEILLKDRSIINWQNGYIIAKGRSRIEFNEAGAPVDALTGKATSLNRARQAAYELAKEAAITKIAEAVKSMRVDPQNQFEDVMRESDAARKIISDKINNSMVCREYPSGFDSSACEVKLYFGSVIASLPYDFPANDFPVRAEIPIATPYSSLIIDCRGLDIKPMLFPSVYGDNGLEIYGKNFIDSVYAAKGGVVSYCYNENQAQLDRRTGEYPYLTVAMKSLNNCPVLLEKDARRILSSPTTINNLKKCKVIFIIDKS